MDIWEADKLVLFIAFLIPGFVSLKTYELLYPSSAKETSALLVDAVAFSCINYAILLWPIYAIEQSTLRSNCLALYLAFYTFVLFITPISWVCILKALRSTAFVRAALPHPTAKPWEYVFGLRKPFWIIATLKDGKKIGGLYGCESFASSAPAPEQLYLEQAWELNNDGYFERPRENTAGIMILADDVVTLELFHVTYGGKNEREEAAERGASAFAEGVPADAAQGTIG